MGINIIFHAILLFLYCFIALAFPPPNPIKCNGVSSDCTLSNSYGKWNDRKECHATTVVYPTTEQELLSAVSNANKNKLKVKVVTKFSHTIPKLACPGTNSQYGINLNNSSNSIMISTEKYSSGIVIDVTKHVVTVDTGVGLRDVIDKVEEMGLSFVAAPYWEGVSIGGIISTGAHGSSWWGNGGAVHDHVVGIRLIVSASEKEGFAKIVSLEGQDPLLNAAKVSLGMLGVISKVTIGLEPAFKRSITYNFTSDEGIEEEFMDHAKKNEFGDIQWYPSKNTAVYRYDSRVPLDTSGDGINDFVGFQSNPILVSKTVRSTEKSAEKDRNVNAKCTEAGVFLGYKKLIANGLKNNNLIFTGYPVVGHQSKMQTSGSCLYSPSYRIDSACSWDPRINGLFFYESTAIFTASSFHDFIKDVKKLRDITNPEIFCGVDLYNGFLIRFIKSSKAYLGQTEDSVVVDFNYYRADDPLTARLNQDLMEEIEQIAFFKYNAKPHWAKNRNVAFIDVGKKYNTGFDKFVAAKKKLDPYNLFSSQWSDEIVFGIINTVINANDKIDGCALEGNCICSQDSHCSPSQGYFCQSGLVYKDARVCRFSPTSSN